MKNKTIIQKPKGTVDLFGDEIIIRNFIKENSGKVLESFGYKEIITPIFENSSLFRMSAGESSDIVQKETYDFLDKGGRSLTLRPEGTAGVARAYVENKLFAPEHIKPLKLFYFGTMYRYERPQKGRQREFYQLGVENFGDFSVKTDFEGINLSLQVLNSMGIKDFKLKINSLGGKESRENYKKELISFLFPFQEELSEDSKKRLNNNPLRILDSKDKKDIEILKNAPKILESLTDDDKERFKELISMLSALKIPFEIDNNLVRGLDYYSQTIFEVDADGSTILGGGRYNELIPQLGGPETGAFGFAIGIERIVSIIRKNVKDKKRYKIYFMNESNEDYIDVIKISENVRNLLLENNFNHTIFTNIQNKNLKNQLKQADKNDVDFSIIKKSDLSNELIIKNMSNREEQKINENDLFNFLETEIYKMENK